MRLKSYREEEENGGHGEEEEEREMNEGWFLIGCLLIGREVIGNAWEERILGKVRLTGWEERKHRSPF